MDCFGFGTSGSRIASTPPIDGDRSAEEQSDYPPHRHQIKCLMYWSTSSIHVSMCYLYDHLPYTPPSFERNWLLAYLPWQCSITVDEGINYLVSLVRPWESNCNGMVLDDAALSEYLVEPFLGTFPSSPVESSLLQPNRKGENLRKPPQRFGTSHL